MVLQLCGLRYSWVIWTMMWVRLDCLSEVATSHSLLLLLLNTSDTRVMIYARYSERLAADLWFCSLPLYQYDEPTLSSHIRQYGVSKTWIFIETKLPHLKAWWRSFILNISFQLLNHVVKATPQSGSWLNSGILLAVVSTYVDNVVP